VISSPEWAEITNITQFYAGKVPNVLIEIAFFFIYFIILFGISSQLGLIILLYLPIQMALFFGFGPGIRARAKISFENGSRHQSRLVETLTNLSVIKTLAMGERQVERLNGTLNASVVSHFSVFKLGLWNTTVIDIFASLNTVFIIYFGSRLVLVNTISLGELIAFHLIAEKIAGPVHSLSLVWEDWQNLKVSQTRIGDLTNIAAENVEVKPALIAKRPFQLECRDVCFDYPGEVSVLSKLNLVFETERPNVIIGPSGCGKSTLGKVLCGLFSRKTGHVLVNGDDIADYDLVSVRRQIAYVEQEPKLFSGTIRENMLFGRPDAVDDDLKVALRSCAAIDFVEKLPLGLDTNIAEWGASLSGGQRQRLVLARAVLSNPAVLILDEPTSALDKAAAQIIQNTLKELAKEIVLIVISHDETIVGSNAHIIDLSKLQNNG